VAEVIVSDEEVATSVTITTAPVVAPVYGFAAGDSSDEDDDELMTEEERIHVCASDEWDERFFRGVLADRDGGLSFA
jgi:hypothetical protein